LKEYNNEINFDSIIGLRIKYNSELSSLEKKLDLINFEINSFEEELNTIEDKFEDKFVLAMKHKFCSVCGQLAKTNLFCCLNANYCSFECKTNHWSKHYIKCLRKKNFLFNKQNDQNSDNEN